MRKMLLVAKREYRFTVRRKGFIIATVGMPVFFALLWGIVGGVALLSVRQSRAKVDTVGIVDESGLLQLELLPVIQKEAIPVDGGAGPLGRKAAEVALPEGGVEFRQFTSADAAREAFLGQEIRGYYVVPRDFLETGRVELDIRKGGFTSDNQPGWNLLRRLVAASLVAGKLPEEYAKRVWLPPALDTKPLKADGSPDKAGALGEVSSFIVPYVFSLLFMVSLMISSGYLLQGVAEEKENRVIEVMLSSVSHKELLAGKVLGLCAAGLTQFGVWILMGAVPAIYFFPDLDLRWSQLLIALLFFVLGFTLYGALMGGLGSLGNNFRESQQTSMVVSLSAVLPLLFMMPILTQPNGTLARVLSYIPLTAPVTIVLRTSATRVPWWDILLSAAIMFGSLFVFIRIAAKLFRLGTLMYGKRPGAVEIARWLRES
jgi:ABC-2 type transport system permease protein